ncbi:dihydropteroate synthase [Nocardioides sp. Root614]|nr:dihydropteroate synthase [Nocardioides sp. Root614]KRA91796.1 dihydropteroate synthase [Nocardioides sp. Root682]
MEALGRCRVLGILNVTPDSFSDGGRFDGVDRAIARGLALVEQGADVVDVGGESTRPGAVRVDEHEELGRVLPVIRALSEEGVTVSVDTMRASVAAAAIESGAAIVNDVSGGLADPAMLAVLADSGALGVLMHWRGHAAHMQQRATYDDVVGEVLAELSMRVDAALAAGVPAEKIVLDPGLGFAKSADQTWSLLAALPQLQSLGLPVLVGASRKRFLAECVDHGGLEPGHPLDRDDASTAVAAIAAAGGAWGVRVHAVPAASAAVRVARRLHAVRSGAGA